MCLGPRIWDLGREGTDKNEDRPWNGKKARSIGGWVCQTGDGGADEGEQGSGYLNQDYGDGEPRYDLEWVMRMGKWTMGWDGMRGQARTGQKPGG